MSLREKRRWNNKWRKGIKREGVEEQLFNIRSLKIVISIVVCLNMYNLLLVTSSCVSLVFSFSFSLLYQFILRMLYALGFIFQLYFIPIFFAVKCANVILK